MCASVRGLQWGVFAILCDLFNMVCALCAILCAMCVEWIGAQIAHMSRACAL